MAGRDGAGPGEAEVEAGARAIIVANGFPADRMDAWWPRQIAFHREMEAEHGDEWRNSRSLVTDAMRSSRVVLEAARPPCPGDAADLAREVERLEHDLMVMTARHAGMGDAADHFFDQFVGEFRKRRDAEDRERDALAMILFVGMCAGDRIAAALSPRPSGGDPGRESTTTDANNNNGLGAEMAAESTALAAGSANGGER